MCRIRPKGRSRDYPAMPASWTELSDDVQLTLARESMRRAAETIAGQAEALAEEFEEGGLEDRGGSEALRLFAALVREVSGSDPTVGRA
jgi:hypothetical protein